MANNDTWTVKRTLDWCVEYLERHGDEHPRRSAEWLMGAATGLSRVEIYAYFDRPLSMEERDELRGSLQRRGAGEPLQYVTGEVGFRHIVLRVDHGVLIPRPETEVLVQVVLDWLKESELEQPSAVEVGCGTGCVALSLAKEAGVQVTATDVSAEALSCANRNVEALALTDLVEVVEADCVAGVEGTFDVLVSNPPYIPTSLMDTLDLEVVGFEPRLALDGGEDGLSFFNRLLSEAAPLLREGGLMACELHETCLDSAAQRMRDAGFKDVSVHQDLAGKPRIISGIR